MKFCSIDGCSTPNFSKDTKTGLPYCRSHQYKRSDYDRRTIMQKALDKNKSLNSKVRGLVEIPSHDEVMRHLWFSARRFEMTGYCQCGCGNKSSKDDDRYFKFSACHILPQRHFQSVQWHPLNWVEMAFWGGCHTNFDNKGSDNWDKLKCWDLIVERFKILYPLTLPEEHEFIPQILLDTL